MPSGQAQHRKLTSSRVPACSCVIIVFHILLPTWKCHQARAQRLYFQHQAYFEDCKMQTVLKPRGAPCLLPPSFLSVSCNAPTLPSSVIFPSPNSPLENLSFGAFLQTLNSQVWCSILIVNWTGFRNARGISKAAVGFLKDSIPERIRCGGRLGMWVAPFHRHGGGFPDFIKWERKSLWSIAISFSVSRAMHKQAAPRFPLMPLRGTPTAMRAPPRWTTP